MFNDKMDVDDMIRDLSTRATNQFCGKDEMQYVCVSFASHKDYPNFWQVWLSHYDHSEIVPSILDTSLSEGKTIRQALIYLDQWLDGINIVNAELCEEDRFQIVESIGFGD